MNKIAKILVAILSFVFFTSPAYVTLGEDSAFVGPSASIEVNISDFRYALTDMCSFISTGFSEGEWRYSNSEKEPSGDYLITIADNVRIVENMRNQMLCKVSVHLEYNNQGATLKELAVISVIEGRLYDKYYISNQDKHRALQYAQDIVEASIYLNGDNMSALYEDDGQNQVLAANGKDVDYYWELIDDELYISAQFVELPDNMK